jgi:hypothetical protein
MFVKTFVVHNHLPTCQANSGMYTVDSQRYTYPNSIAGARSDHANEVAGDPRTGNNEMMRPEVEKPFARHPSGLDHASTTARTQG